jgi:hypothetical protein
MEPDRFDDVESTILEAPEPSERGRLRRRVALVMAVSLIAGGSLAAGASALTSSGETAAAPPKLTRDAEGWMRYAPLKGHPCHRGEHKRAPSSDLRY